MSDSPEHIRLLPTGLTRPIMLALPDRSDSSEHVRPIRTGLVIPNRSDTPDQIRLPRTSLTSLDISASSEQIRFLRPGQTPANMSDSSEHARPPPSKSDSSEHVRPSEPVRLLRTSQIHPNRSDSREIVRLLLTGQTLPNQLTQVTGSHEGCWCLVCTQRVRCVSPSVIPPTPRSTHTYVMREVVALWAYCSTRDDELPRSRGCQTPTTQRKCPGCSFAFVIPRPRQLTWHALARRRKLWKENVVVSVLANFKLTPIVNAGRRKATRFGRFVPWRKRRPEGALPSKERSKFGPRS